MLNVFRTLLIILSSTLKMRYREAQKLAQNHTVGGLNPSDLIFKSLANYLKKKPWRKIKSWKRLGASIWHRLGILCSGAWSGKTMELSAIS